MPHTKKLTNNSLAVSVQQPSGRTNSQFIERRIYLIRGHKVMIDVDLAELYGVPTKRLNQQVSRNLKRFPEDFMFQLTKVEAEALRLQFATSKPDAVDGAHCRTSSPNKVWQCCRVTRYPQIPLITQIWREGRSSANLLMCLTQRNSQTIVSQYLFNSSSAESI